MARLWQARGMRPARQTRYALAHHLDSWRADDRIAARGFVHRWDSVVADGNGEDFFLQLLPEYLLSARSLYDRLAYGTVPPRDPVPPWDSVAAEAEAAYAANQADGALTLRHVRLVWAVQL